MWINNNKEQSLVYKPIFTDCLTHAQKEDVEGFPPLNVDDCAEINRHFTPYIFTAGPAKGAIPVSVRPAITNLRSIVMIMVIYTTLMIISSGITIWVPAHVAV